MSGPSVFLALWHALADQLDLRDEPAGSLGDELLVHHQQPDRHYHTVDHIVAVLHHLDTLERATPTTKLAAFFHDAIYDPTATDNEDRSADLARRELESLGLDSELIEAVTRIIRATAGHEIGDGSHDDMAAFLDADLAILGTQPDVYARYTAAIRREYHHLGDQEFRDGRRRVLEHFAARDTLYFTSAGQQLWEASARRNLAVELATL